MPKHSLAPDRDSPARPPRARQALLEQAVIPLLVATYGLVSWDVTRSYGAPLVLSATTYFSYLGATLPIFFFLVGVIYPIKILFSVRHEKLMRYIAADLKKQRLRERLTLGLPMLVVLPLFFSIFSGMKALITVIHPFSWDADFARADRWLHGGYAPWELLQPVLGTATGVLIVSAFYNFWFFVLLTILIWQSFSPYRRQLRMQFLIAHILVWSALGTLMATLLSSAGPCFYGRLPGHDDLYAPLTQQLESFSKTGPAWSLRLQDILWTAYKMKEHPPFAGEGISAMPSIHVACSLLMALLGWRCNRALGIGLTMLLVMILTGSVYLGWHYAVDGYASLILVPPIWWLSGRVAQRMVGQLDLSQSISE